MTGLLLAQAADPERVRRLTQEVLSQPDYRAATGPSLLERGIAWVLEQLGRLLLEFDGGGGEGSVLAAIALLLVVVAILAGVAAFVARLRRSRTLEVVVEGPVGRSATDWRAEAERHEAAGDLRQALRCRYRETLAALAADGLVEEIPGRTTGEYARAVTLAVPAATDPFGRLTRAFEDTWYGGRPVDVELLAQVRQAQRDTVAAAGLRRARIAA